MTALEPLSIAYITETAAQDKHAWSGTAHYIYNTLLKSGYNVTPLGPAVPETLRLFLGSINKISLTLTGRRFDYRHSVPYSKAFGRIFSEKLKTIRHDLVVVCGGTEYAAYLQTNKPVYLVLDRTIAGAINYHQILQDLWPFSCKQSVYTDKLAMEKASKIFFSSQWAADHARLHYGLPSSKMCVLPFGANLDEVPPAQEVLKEKASKPFRLLFIGSSWENKGGPIAYKALQIVRSAGYDVTLTVVGCTPPADVSANNNVHIIPFVNKNSNEGMSQFRKLLLEHHALILPTRFDCTPIVFCEASAFALPVLSAETGGVASHVKEGVNGFLLPYLDMGEGYARQITALINQPALYESLRKSARTLYETTLNWNQWAKSFSEEISRT